ncbi:MAG: AI-2E family transporter [Chitinophagales bacterium]|nr:AI-2E family transporter [Bacteroidota bacterium]MBX7141951.1 AI-2E family transporter [Chitinophagales bacterium]
MTNSPFLRFLLAMACIVVIVAGIKAIASTLVIVLFAVLIAQCLHPLTAWLRRKTHRSVLSVAITILVVLIIGSGVVGVVGSAVVSIKAKLPEYSAKISEMSTGVISMLKDRGIDITSATQGASDPQKIQSIALAFFGGLASLIGNSVFILILIVVLLIEFEAVNRKIEKKGFAEGSLMYKITDLNKLSSTFIGIQALVGLMQGVASTIVLLILGVDFAIMWGVLFFFLNFVPVVGFLLAVIMPTMVALLEQGNTTAIIVFVSWYAINIFFDNVVRPRLLKQSFDVSFLAILLVLLFWTFVLGPAGAILAIPLSLSLKVLYDAFSEQSKQEAAGDRLL